MVDLELLRLRRRSMAKKIRLEIKEILDAFSGAIEGIDGGCIHCIGGFVEEANEILKESGIGYFYDIEKRDKYYYRVILRDRVEKES